MPDTFTTTKTIGYGSRIGNSFKGIFGGFLLIIIAIGLLYWNEGRQDLSALARQSKVVSADQVSSDPAMQDQLVSVTGTLTAQGQLGDGLFLKPGNYVSVSRTVEMYAWVEQQSTQTTTNANGSQTQTTTQTYTEKWTDAPQSSSNFTEPAGHQNPDQLISSSQIKAANIQVGAYAVAETGSVQLPAGSGVILSKTNTMLSGKASLAGQNYIFVPDDATSMGSFADPQIGDLRISYAVLRPGMTSTLMGKLNGASIEPYFDQNNNELYRIFTGTRDEAISQLHSEYEVETWILRAVGFVLMFIGFLMIASPISVILSIVPVVGGIGAGLIFFASFLLSVVLTIVTILVSMLFHSLIALGIAIVVVIVASIVWLKSRKAKTVQPTV